MDLNLFRQDIKKICLLIAFQQSLSSGQKTSDFRRYWQILVKNRCRFIAYDLKAFFLFFCFDFLQIDPSNNFCFCKFFAKGLKSEGERQKFKYWSLKIVKIGRGQHAYRHCCRCHRLQSFVMMKTTVLSNQQWMPWEIPNKINLLAVAILFLFTFFTLIFDSPPTDSESENFFPEIYTFLKLVCRIGKPVHFGPLYPGSGIRDW